MQLDPQEYWNKIACSYGDLYTDPYSKFEDNVVKSVLQTSGVGSGVTCLELGCGAGLGATIVKDLGVKHYFGVDISDAMLNLGRASHPELSFLKADMEALPSSIAASDVVFCINGVGSYANSIRRFAETFYEKTNPGGRIVASFLNRWALRRFLRFRVSSTEPLQTRGAAASSEGTVQRLYGQQELKHEFSSVGFTDVRVFSYGLFAGWFQNSVTAGLESALPILGRYLGHALILTGEKR